LAGLYLHIPYCKKACYYCDFHFSTNLGTRSEMIKAICTEIVLRQGELNETIDTIYWGGGTPSILEESEFKIIFNTLYKYFDLSNIKECTIECNPEDLTEKKLKMLQQLPFDRLSIGVQTFKSEILKSLNRSHTGEESTMSIQRSLDAGFSNITCDLIYGIPGVSLAEFNEDVTQLLDFSIPHVSAYCLTVEEKTALKTFIKNGKFASLNEQEAIDQYLQLKKSLAEAGVMQYEISNFAKKGYESKHNSSYWQNKNYLGFGPGAHSYYQSHRSYNVSHNHQYIRALAKNTLAIEREELSKEDKINDYILTRIRTIWGISLTELNERFAYDLYKKQANTIEKYLNNGWLKYNNDALFLSEKGSLMADEIAMNLFVG